MKIIFLPSVNKPDAKRAAELLGPIVADIWQMRFDKNEKQGTPLPAEEEKPALRRNA